MRVGIVHELRGAIDRLLHVVAGIHDDDLVAAAFGSRLDGVLDHRPAVELEQQLLRAGHSRARAGREHDRADGKERRREAIDWRPGRADPFHLDVRAEGERGEVAQTAAVAVDQQQPPAGERGEIGDGGRQADHGHRAAIVSRGHVLQRGLDVAPAHDHAVRSLRLAIGAPSDGQLEVTHYEHHSSLSMPDSAG